MIINALLFWIVLLVLFYLALEYGTRNAPGRMQTEPPPLPTGDFDSYRSRLVPMLSITGYRMAGGVFEFYGFLRGAAEQTYSKIRAAFAGEPVTPVLLEGEHDEVCVLFLPKEAEHPSRGKPRWWLHWGLFAVTLATTTWAGALHAGVNLLAEPGRFGAGLPYSLGLLLILGAHELGHYFTAKKHGIQVTPPFFIPVPFALGTFGAFIRIKSITPSRPALFDVAVAGPLAGLVFAVPALVVGLRFSHVLPADTTGSLGQVGVNVGSSILLSLLAKLSLGVSVYQGDHLLLHPLAFAGWLGLIVTALNLLPIGQLDGGHISHALFGSRKAHIVSVVALVLLFLLALFVWQGLMFWAFIVYLIAGTYDAPAANDVTPLGGPRKALGYFAFLLLLLIIVPVPHALYEAIGIHSPYV